MRYELLLKGGQMVDPAQGIKGRRDVAFAIGRVAAVGSDVDPGLADRVIDVAGKYVVPGLIDFHAHVYWGGTSLGVVPDETCLPYGVTTVVDAGSAGCANFAGFRPLVMERSRCRVLAFLHVANIGLVYTGVPELANLGYADPVGAARCVAANRDVLLGIKVRVGRRATLINDHHALRLAVQAAEIAGVPVMVHVGDSAITMPQILDTLRQGDIVTHCLTGHPNGIVDADLKLLRAVWDARQRGIIFDTAHGSTHVSFRVARAVLSQGFVPDVFSTDLAGGNVAGGCVKDMPTTLSKFLVFGVPFKEVIERATAAPAKLIGKEGELGTLRVGAMGDAAVLEVHEGEFEYQDSMSIYMTGSKRITCALTVKDGQVVASKALG